VRQIRKGARAGFVISSVASAMMASALVICAWNFAPASVSAWFRPFVRTSAMPSRFSELLMCRGTPVGLTSSASAAARTPPVVPTASKARNAVNGRGPICFGLLAMSPQPATSFRSRSGR
jgi:hypothetical protein